MNKYMNGSNKFIAVSVLAVLMSVSPVLGLQDMRSASARGNAGKPVTEVFIPNTDRSEKVVPLGLASDVDGKAVEGYAIIHYKNGKGRLEGRASKNPAASCYGFLARGARWKATEPYVVQGSWVWVDDGTASGTFEYEYSFDTDAVARDLDVWDSQVVFDVFGNQATFAQGAFADGADTVSPDGQNEIMWGSISDQGAIAVTIVWGIFSGPPSGRSLVEWDVVFDNVDYVWGDATTNPAAMDFENIATHEFGHAAGMGDLYELQCSVQTMYGYADYGETNKRTLEVGDINGIKALYK